MVEFALLDAMGTKMATWGVEEEEDEEDDLDDCDCFATLLLFLVTVVWKCSSSDSSSESSTIVCTFSVGFGTKKDFTERCLVSPTRCVCQWRC